MQVVAFDIADDVAVDIYLVQVSGIIIQFVDGSPIRQGSGDIVAQWFGRSLVVIYARPDRFVQLISQQSYIGNS